MIEEATGSRRMGETSDGGPPAVMFVCQHDVTGPSEKQAIGFAQQLVKRGHRVLVAFGVEDGSVEGEGLLLPVGLDVAHYRFQGRRLRSQDTARAIQFAPTLIHAFNCRVPTVAATIGYARATGAPVFMHFEDNEWEPWGGLPGESPYYRLGRHVRRAQGLVQPRSWPHSTVLSRGWARRHAVAFDALTPELAAEVTRRFGRECETLLPISPELNGPPPAEIELPATVSALPIVLFTGTLYPFSLADAMQGLRAIAALQRKGHRLAYVHPGNIHPRIDPVALANDAGLEPGTYAFPGWLPYAAMPSLLQRATVLLQPGGPTEFNRLRLPAKLQAYLESGTPTITFATGSGRLLKDRQEVLKIHTDDWRELADRLEELLTDRDLRARLSAGARRAAERLFDPERNSEALVAHYRAHVRR